jgi:hypothetical protein
MNRLAKLKRHAKKGRTYSKLRIELKTAQERFDAVATVEARVNDELQQARLAIEADVDQQTTMQEHEARIAQLRREIAEERKVLAGLDQKFLREKHRQIARNQYEIIDQKKRLTQAKNDDIARLMALAAFYNERLSVVRARLNVLKGRSGDQGGRQSDLDLIEKLTQDLRVVKARLRAAMNEQDESQAEVLKQEPHVRPRPNERVKVRMRASRART